MISTLLDHDEGKVSISVFKKFKNRDDTEPNIGSPNITDDNPSTVVVTLFAQCNLFMNQMIISNLTDLKKGQKILKFDGFSFICFA